ncbi:MAG: flagellar hook-length control protein FliK [Sphingomonas sp.]|uniref:flagellar hook-length control protein FliK n=1 Tax=Sphingomonas sp. TaxID=28214 RepID=UPI0025E72A96|nr:flagellar hook-length control protein FliK [Sphingomonas sp.]MBQ1496868.1 flagellar hook-length control protein FliK [Sphingomonas sp.]
MQINTIGFPAGLLGAGSADPAAGIGFAQMLGAPGNPAGTGLAPPPAANDLLAPAAPLSMAQLLTTAAPAAAAEAPPVEVTLPQPAAPAEAQPAMGAQPLASAPPASTLPAMTEDTGAPAGKPPLPGTEAKPAKPAANAPPAPAPAEPAIDTPATPAAQASEQVQAVAPEEPKAPVKRGPPVANTEDEPRAADPAAVAGNAQAADMVAAAIVQVPPRPELAARPQPAPNRQIGESASPMRKADAVRGGQGAAQAPEPAAGSDKTQAATPALAGKPGAGKDNAQGDDRGQAPAFTLRHDAPPAPTAPHAATDTPRTQAAPAMAAAEPVVAARPGHLGQALGVEIARKVEAGDDMLRVRLSPDNLGKVEVTLSFDDAGTLRATVRADSAHALDLLRQDAPDLGRALDQAGIRADAQSFRFESRTGDGNAQAQQQQQQNQNSATGQHAGGDEPDTTDIAYRGIRGDGQVDLLA